MDLLIARLIDGFSNGLIYGFLALALVCVYRGTGHLNLAQGEMAMFSAFLAYTLHAAGLPMVLTVLVTVAVSGAGAVAVERVLIRPLGQHADYSILLVTIGLFLALHAAAGVIWGTDPLQLPTIIPSAADLHFEVAGTRVRFQQVATLVIVLGTLAALHLVFRFTKLGLAMRATATSPANAELLGIRVGRVHAVGWALAGGIGALAGILVAPSTSVTTNMMLNFLVYAAAAATLGGFDSPGGAVLAGVILGVAENLISSYVPAIGSDLKQAVALVALLVVLMVRPTGLFGSAKVVRV